MKIRVFHLKVSEYHYVDHIFLCRGIACDRLNLASRYKNDIVESTLDAPSKDALRFGMPVYCASYSPDGLRPTGTTGWYTSPLEATDAAVSAFVCAPEDVCLMSAVLNTDTIAPVQQPIRVKLYKSPLDQRLSCRINLHPEWDGKNNPGKLFFPDRSWTTATKGEALVRVTHEKQTYGFLTGEMVKFDDISEDIVLDYIYKTYSGTQYVPTLIRIDSPTFGQCFIESKQCFGGEVNRLVLDYENGEEEVRPIAIDADFIEDMKADGAKFTTIDPVAIILQRAFGPDTSAEERLSHFTASEFVNAFTGTRPKHRLVNTHLVFQEACPEKYSDLLADAIEEGLFSIFRCQSSNAADGLYAVVLNKAYVMRFAAFAPEEFDALVQEANGINKQTDDAIIQLARKGRIRLVNA